MAKQAKKAKKGKKGKQGQQGMTFDGLVEKVLDDPAFRAELIKDPRSALKEEGIPVTNQMVTALNKVDYASISRVAQLFGRDPKLHPDTGFT